MVFLYKYSIVLYNTKVKLYKRYTNKKYAIWCKKNYLKNNHMYICHNIEFNIN